jgi:hypothetical protein
MQGIARSCHAAEPAAKKSICFKLPNPKPQLNFTGQKGQPVGCGLSVLNNSRGTPQSVGSTDTLWCGLANKIRSTIKQIYFNIQTLHDGLTSSASHQ